MRVNLNETTAWVTQSDITEDNMEERRIEKQIKYYSVIRSLILPSVTCDWMHCLSPALLRCLLILPRVMPTRPTACMAEMASRKALSHSKARGSYFASLVFVFYISRLFLNVLVESHNVPPVSMQNLLDYVVCIKEAETAATPRPSPARRQRKIRVTL